MLVSFHLEKHVRREVGGFGKKSYVSTGVRKPGNTCASPTAVKVALNPNTTNQRSGQLFPQYLQKCVLHLAPYKTSFNGKNLIMFEKAYIQYMYFIYTRFQNKVCTF